MQTPNSPGRKPARAIRATLVAALLASTALGGYAAGHDGWADTTAGAASPAPATITPTPGQTQSGAIQPTPSGHYIPDFSSLVREVRPAVVSITTHLKMNVADQDGNIPAPFRGMFPGGGGGHPQAIEARGSGFIINADGIIVTNNHVVRDAQSVVVNLEDGTQLPAKILGTDPRTDIAVLKVDAHHPLPFLQLGDSNDVEPGQWVVAVGNPFGLGGTVTAGIVSARGRDIGDGPYDSFIQIDAPINEGNSGGPLFTQDGKVVGINTAILSPSGGSVGIGFAIPSNTVKSVAEQLEHGGKVVRGYLGVEAQRVTPTMASALRLPDDSGALVASVQPDSPASRGGVQPGDLIDKVNGESVSNPRDLAIDIAGVKPGDTANLDIVRDGSHQTVSVKVATLPPEQTAQNGQAGDQQQQQGVGLALAPITPDVRDQLNLPASTRGAVVAQVQPDSPAAQAGLQSGDVVVGVGDKSVDSASDAAGAIRAATRSGQPVALRIMRNGQSIFVAVNPKATANSGADDDSQG